MFPALVLDPQSDIPLYRQLHEQIRTLVQSGRLSKGERLPATRELAGLLGLNRATVSAAYELLEKDGLIQGHVGRGSFIADAAAPTRRINWEEFASLPPAPQPAVTAAAIRFSTSSPAEDLFPMAEFRSTVQEVLDGDGASHILQLGSPAGYAPLRDYLLERARERGFGRDSDDVIVTSGCQQALDLIHRVLVRPGDAVVVEDPVYPGLHSTVSQSGARLLGIPIGLQGLDIEYFERVMERERPRAVVLTPNFQNPTGLTLSLPARLAVLRAVRQAGSVLIENDAYGELRYEGEPLPSLKQLDDSADVVHLGSFSKIAFPGLRVGWVIAPRAFTSRLAVAKQWCDLHTDQLSQAVVLRFAESGRLAAHRTKILAAGSRRLAAVLAACEQTLPSGTRFTRPQGGMNLWVRLPEPLDAGELLARAERENVTYLPGRYFAVNRVEPGALRLSFAGLTPDHIRAGVSTLGEIFRLELDRVRAVRRLQPVTALV